MNHESNERYLTETGAILGQILDYGGRRMAPGLTVDDLVWAIEAIESGYMLRRRAALDVTDRRVYGYTVVQTAILAVVEDFTVGADA